MITQFVVFIARNERARRVLDVRAHVCVCVCTRAFVCNIAISQLIECYKHLNNNNNAHSIHAVPPIQVKNDNVD